MTTDLDPDRVQLLVIAVPPEQGSRTRDGAAPPLVVTARYVGQCLEVRKIEPARGRFGGEGTPFSGHGLQVCIAEWEIRGNGIEAPDSLWVTAADTLFREPLVGKPSLDLRWSTIERVEVEEIVQVNERVDQRRAQLTEYNVEG